MHSWVRAHTLINTCCTTRIMANIIVIIFIFKIYENDFSLSSCFIARALPSTTHTHTPGSFRRNGGFSGTLKIAEKKLHLYLFYVHAFCCFVFYPSLSTFKFCSGCRQCWRLQCNCKVQWLQFRVEYAQKPTNFNATLQSQCQVEKKGRILQLRKTGERTKKKANMKENTHSLP